MSDSDPLAALRAAASSATSNLDLREELGFRSMKLILVNGPPRCGKDTAMLALRDHFTDSCIVNCERFSGPIKEALAGLLELELDDVGNLPIEGDNKESIILPLGCSYRQWQIDFSEKFMKPLYGQNVFARLFIQRIKPLEDEDEDWLVVVPDCGFQIELDAVLAAFPPTQVALIRLYRKGTSFHGDSREYVEPRNRCTFLPIANIGTKQEFEARILRAVTPFIEAKP